MTPRWRRAGRGLLKPSRRLAGSPSGSLGKALTTLSSTTLGSSRPAAKPVVIGDSFGGVIVQRLLGQDLAAAGVAIDPAPIKGVLDLPLSALRVASIALRQPANRDKAVSLTAEQFRYGFGNAPPAEESTDLFERWTVPSPGKPLFEDALATFIPAPPPR